MRKECVTLWHRENDEEFTKTVFSDCFVTLINELEVYKSERTQKNSLRVRIYSRLPCQISTGDRICIGCVTDTNPPKNSYIIARLKENFAASCNLKHYRIDCV